MRKIKYCLDCNKQLGISAPYNDVQRCHSCNTKHLFQIGKLNQSGENHSHYKTGLPKCLDCGKQLCNYYAVRCHSCCQKGNLHPNWIDGRSYEGYPLEFTETLKESIRYRDNHECQNCYITQEEHIIIMNWRLTIHHIDYDRQNCNRENLITLCHQCNLRANYNREYWQGFYINKMKEIIIP